MPKIFWLQFSNMRSCCISLFYDFKLNITSHFGLFEQIKQFEDITLTSEKLWWAFSIFWNIILIMIIYLVYPDLYFTFYSELCLNMGCGFSVVNNVFLKCCWNCSYNISAVFHPQAWRWWWRRQNGARGHASLPQPAAVLPGQAVSGAHGHQVGLLRQAGSRGEYLLQHSYNIKFGT